MNDPMQERMAEAARLTRAGRLMEATETIQRALGGMPAGISAPAAPVEPPIGGVADSRWAAWRNKRSATGTPVRAPEAPPEVPKPAGQFVAGAYTNAAGTRTY
ncbi:MAG TPA: hypothetical protein VFE42_26280, partial [Chloroflexota bacterium]|nr:hypothetical protein [Chloroflexota bacterium]